MYANKINIYKYNIYVYFTIVNEHDPFKDVVGKKTVAKCLCTFTQNMVFTI